MALALVVVSVVAARRPLPPNPPLVDMAQSAQALEKAGTLMIDHGQTMTQDGQRAGNTDLTAEGQQWVIDGQTVVQQRQWLAMDPTAPVNLDASPGELAKQGNWETLSQGAQAMLHDPSRASSIDLEALRWDGEAMRSEGQDMIDHALVLTERVDVMVARTMLTDSAASDLRQSTKSLRDIGSGLMQNGQSMVDYADQLRQSLGCR